MWVGWFVRIVGVSSNWIKEIEDARLETDSGY